MEPPFSVVQKPSFGLQLIVQRRPGIRHQDIIGRKAEFVLQGKAAGFPDALHGVRIVPHGKGRPGLQTVAAKLPDGVLILILDEFGVDALSHGPDAFGLDGFKADHVAETAAFQHQVHQLLVLQHINTALTDPLDLQRDQPAEKLLCLFLVRYDIIVHEKDQLALLGADLFHHLVYVPAEMPLLEIDAGGAVFAVVSASPAELHQSDRHILFILKQNLIHFLV